MILFRPFFVLILLLLALWSFVHSPGKGHAAGNAAEPTLLAFTPLVEVPEAPGLQIAQGVRDLKRDRLDGLEFMPLMRTGDADNGEIFGALKDRDGRTLTFDDGTPYLCNGTNGVPGSGPDFVSILDDPDGSGRRYMVTQFECPLGAYYINELEQEASGRLRARPQSLQFVSQNAYHGGWTHCSGSKTPWESHLGSEEYEPDGRIIASHRGADGLSGFGAFDETAKFFNGDATAANPYFWGWVTEVSVEEPGVRYRKHYALGRFSHELAYVMPDARTLYMSDDGTNVGLFMFVADHAANLNGGTLYGARWKQRSEYEGGGADLEWINLGHASEAEVRRAVEARPRFGDLFDVREPDETGVCEAGFGAVNTAGRVECLRLRRDRYSEAVISRLETRRYAALKGATTEFRKEEGITYDPDHRRLYVAMSSLSHGMLEGESTFDAGGPDAIRLAENGCGAVYALSLGDGPARDDAGAEIASGYVATQMEAVVTGRPQRYAADSPHAGNECDVEGIANPDNLSYLPGSNLLVIAEDSKKHLHNVVWGYDVESGSLQRIASLPKGAEATSTYWQRDIGGYDYLTLTVQHPEVDDNQSYVGVIGPFPAAGN